MSEHYQKYRNTIRRVARRHRRLRDKWINEQLRNKSCKYCGESEIVVLKFYPDDRKIRSESKKHGFGIQQCPKITTLERQIDSQNRSKTTKKRPRATNSALKGAKHAQEAPKSAK